MSTRDQIINLSTDGIFFWLVLSSAAIFLCAGCIFYLFKRLGLAVDQLERLNHAVSRLERDLNKHRYAIAVSAGEANGPEIVFGKTDRQLMNDVIEQAETLVEETKTPAFATAAGLNDGEILGFLKKALANKGIAVYQQPLVSLPARKTHYYEVFSRIMVGDGSYIPANKFIAVAKNNNLVDAIDNLLLMQCLQILKNSGDKEKQVDFFINVTSQTFSSKDYMTNLLAFLSANPRLSTRLIFEITQKDSLNLGPTAKTVMERLALLGCRFSMDQVMILGMDLDRLLDLNISFVKLDMNALQKDLADTSARKRIKRIKNSLDVQGINVIIEKVENEKQLFNVLDMHFDTGQGYLFGKPELMV